MDLIAAVIGGDQYIKKERETWFHHVFKKNEAYKSRMDAVQSETHVKLCYYESKMYALKYLHYFLITVPSNLICEFHGSDHFTSIYEIHNKTMQQVYKVEADTQQTEFTKEMKERLAQVEGFTNYSLLLRNCEHVAKYIYYGKWYSNQVATASSDNIFANYIKRATDDTKKLVNTPPHGLTSYGTYDVVVDIKDNWKFTTLEAGPLLVYKARKDSYNVLLVGPTGAGKSTSRKEHSRGHWRHSIRRDLPRHV
jgi:hypothetical protein